MIRKKNGKGEMHSLALLLNNMEKGALGMHPTRIRSGHCDSIRKESGIEDIYRSRCFL